MIHSKGGATLLPCKYKQSRGLSLLAVEVNLYSVKMEDLFMENKFIRLADLPPDPTNIKALEHYRQLGMNVCLLTEDQVKLVDGGTVSQDYKNAIQ